MEKTQVANQEAGRDSTFETELYSFLAELTKTSDMSSLENSLGRLKLAMMEEANRTDGAGMEGKNERFNLYQYSIFELQTLTLLPPLPLPARREPRTLPWTWTGRPAAPALPLLSGTPPTPPTPLSPALLRDSSQLSPAQVVVSDCLSLSFLPVSNLKVSVMMSEPTPRPLVS